jgi:hypothetical protein
MQPTAGRGHEGAEWVSVMLGHVYSDDDGFDRAVDRTHAKVTQRDDRKLYRRFLSSSVDKEKIKDMTTHLDRSLKHFAVRPTLCFISSLPSYLKRNAASP